MDTSPLRVENDGFVVFEYGDVRASRGSRGGGCLVKGFGIRGEPPSGCGRVAIGGENQSAEGKGYK